MPRVEKCSRRAAAPRLQERGKNVDAKSHLSLLASHCHPILSHPQPSHPIACHAIATQAQLHSLLETVDSQLHFTLSLSRVSSSFAYVSPLFLQHPGRAELAAARLHSTRAHNALLNKLVMRQKQGKQEPSGINWVPQEKRSAEETNFATHLEASANDARVLVNSSEQPVHRCVAGSFLVLRAECEQKTRAPVAKHPTTRIFSVTSTFYFGNLCSEKSIKRRTLINRCSRTELRPRTRGIRGMRIVTGVEGARSEAMQRDAL